MVNIICAHAYPPPARRARRVDIVNVDMHYKPKRSRLSYVTEKGVDVTTDEAEWQAFIIKPDNNYRLSGKTLHIPTLVLNLVMRQLKTLQLAAYTLESAVGIIDFFDNNLRTSNSPSSAS